MTIGESQKKTSPLTILVDRRYLFVLFFSGLLSILFSACEGQREIVISGNTMGTTYSIKYLGEKIIEKERVDHLLDSFNQVLSTYIPNSHINQFNHKYDSFLQGVCHPWLLNIAAESKNIWQITEGYFDISAAPLFNAYGFGEAQKQEIDSLLRDSLLQLVGMDKLLITQNVLRKKNYFTQINANAIAKGYGVDVLADFLVRRGVTNYLVEIGGELRACGKNSRGQWWKVGINKPYPGASSSSQIKQVSLKNRSVATSGNYRNYYLQKGKKIVHTINPKTGLAEETNMISASILSKSCLEADAYATAAMAMGVPKCLNFLEQKNLSAYLVFKRGNEWQDTILGSFAFFD